MTASIHVSFHTPLPLQNKLTPLLALYLERFATKQPGQLPASYTFDPVRDLKDSTALRTLYTTLASCTPHAILMACDVNLQICAKHTTFFVNKSPCEYAKRSSTIIFWSKDSCCSWRYRAWFSSRLFTCSSSTNGVRIHARMGWNVPDLCPPLSRCSPFHVTRMAGSPCLNLPSWPIPA